MPQLTLKVVLASICEGGFGCEPVVSHATSVCNLNLFASLTCNLYNCPMDWQDSSITRNRGLEFQQGSIKQSDSKGGEVLLLAATLRPLCHLAQQLDLQRYSNMSYNCKAFCQFKILIGVTVVPNTKIGCCMGVPFSDGIALRWRFLPRYTSGHGTLEPAKVWS
ncbi:hypothetical protein ACRRTK_024671 [Alexandromys fortis]